MPEQPDRPDDDAAPDGDDQGDRKRPTPVRAKAPTPVRQSMPPVDDAGRPVPVREAMEAEKEPSEPIEPPTLTFEIGDEEWLVRTEGRGVTGLPGDPGAPLLFLTFARSSEPERRLREVVAVARRLDDLDPAHLASLFERSRAFKGAWGGDELFPETRKGRPSRR